MNNNEKGNILLIILCIIAVLGILGYLFLALTR